MSLLIVHDVVRTVRKLRYDISSQSRSHTTAFSPGRALSLIIAGPSFVAFLCGALATMGTAAALAQLFVKELKCVA